MEYITSKNIENSNGIIGLSTAVFESIASLSIDDLPFVQLMNNFRLGKGVECKIEDNHIILNLDIKIKTGNNVNLVCRKTQEAILSSIHQMTEFSNVIINLSVKGFYI